jgi:N6-adenosine-specific RNA methylase IME4
MARRSARKRVPDPEYLLGYVDDNESMDCIMKKFKQLEEYQDKVGRSTLTTDDCRELINNTTIGSIKNMFRLRYDFSDDYSSSSEEVNEGRHSQYMDPVTQSYKTVQPGTGQGSLVHSNIFNLKLDQKFEAILINPPKDMHIKIKSKLKFLKNFMDKGLVFLWSPKNEIKEWVETMEKFKFNYVENLVWVQVDKEKIKNAGGLENLKDFSTDLLSVQPGSPFASAHVTLLMFRKASNSKLELRHQRSCDVVFDFERPKNYVYHMIETLLPEAGTKLELWADNDTRAGWIHILHLED